MAGEMESRSPMEKMVSRRKVLSLAGMGGLGMVIAAACASATPTPTATPLPPATATPKPVKDTLRVVFAVISTVADPHVGPAKDRQWYRSAYEAVLEEDFVNMGLKPRLASEAPAFDADGNMTIKIREGVKFHGGEELTAEDVKFSIERIANPDNGAWDARRFGEGNLKGVEVVDPLTLKLIVNEAPKPALYSDLGRLYVMPKAWAEGKDTSHFVDQANGTGPFKLVSYVPEQVAKLERFDGYWGGKAGFKNLEFRFNGEEAARLAMLQRGEADIIVNLPPDLTEVAKAAGLQVLSANTQGPAYVALHTVPEENPVDPGKPNPLRDIRVRQAMNYMIDREAIIKGILKGYAYPMHSWIPSPLMRGYVNPDELTNFSYDPDKAKALLKAAGYEGGFKARLRQREKGWIKGVEVGAAIIDQLREFNIEVEHDPLASAVWVSSLFGKETAPMHLELGWPAPIDPWLLPRGALQFFRWSEIAGMDDAFANTYQMTTEDQNTQLASFTKRFWEEVPAIWLWHPSIIWAATPDISWESCGMYYGCQFEGAKPV